MHTYIHIHTFLCVFVQIKVLYPLKGKGSISCGILIGWDNMQKTE